MEHLASIIWLFSWPVLIFITYKLSVYALKLFNNNIEKE